LRATLIEWLYMELSIGVNILCPFYGKLCEQTELLEPKKFSCNALLIYDILNKFRTNEEGFTLKFVSTRF